MNRTSRLIAAGVGALALVTAGVTGAFAADPITPSTYYSGSIYLINANDGEPWTSAVTTFDDQVVAGLAAGDAVSKFPIPAGATGVYTFVSPRGSESTTSTWNAKAPQGLTAGGVWLPNVSLTNQGVLGGGTPNGINAVKAAGGDYSLGVAFTTANGITVVPGGLYFAHITVTAGSGSFTFTPTEAATTPTTTSVTVPSPAPSENTAFSLSATVSPAAATGNVEFFDGTTSLGTAPVAAGSATLNVAAGLPGGSHSITAHYVGDASYGASTSAASALTIAGTPVPTSLVVSATSATGFAGSPVVYTATVTPSAATGSVAFSALKAGDTTPVNLGSFPVTAGAATATLSGLGAGSWTVTGAFTGTGLFQVSTGTAALTLTVDPNSNNAPADPQTVTVEVPKGALTITTPWTPTNPLALGSLVLNQATSTFELAAPVAFASSTDIANGIKIVNSRPDQPHFTAQVSSTNFASTGGSFLAGTASLIHLASHQVPGNALVAADVHPTDITALANTAQTFATYGASSLGTAWLSGDIDIKGVPTSTPSGVYTATVTFTAF